MGYLAPSSSLLRKLSRLFVKDSEKEKEIAKEKEYKETVLNWLSLLTFKDRHHAIRSLRQPDTGGWFFETEEFKEWLEGNKNSALWCPGIRKLYIPT